MNFVEYSLEQGSVVSTERDLIIRTVCLGLSNDIVEKRCYYTVF
jgi:hypothetical protein